MNSYLYFKKKASCGILLGVLCMRASNGSLKGSQIRRALENQAKQAPSHKVDNSEIEEVSFHLSVPDKKNYKVSYRLSPEEKRRLTLTPEKKLSDLQEDLRQEFKREMETFYLAKEIKDSLIKNNLNRTSLPEIVYKNTMYVQEKNIMDYISAAVLIVCYACLLLVGGFLLEAIALLGFLLLEKLAVLFSCLPRITHQVTCLVENITASSLL